MNLLDRPIQVYPVLVVALVGLFSLSFVGNTGKHKPTHGTVYLVGAIGWFGFLIVVLVTVLYSVALGIHTLCKRGIVEVNQS